MTIDKIWMPLLLAYFIFQAISDAKTGLVYSFWNNLSTVVCSFMAIIYLILRQNSVSFMFLIDAIMIFASCLILCYERKGKRIMQPADAKAIWQIFCISFITLGNNGALYATAFSVLFSSVSFMVYYRIIKRSFMHDRKPYFPFLAFGYGIVSVLSLGLYK